jgi:short-subunit dehydrogenase
MAIVLSAIHDPDHWTLIAEVLAPSRESNRNHRRTDMTKQSDRGTALITGASAGIGAVYADRLARRGYDLILVARDRVRLAGVATRLSAGTGRKVEVLAADLTRKADLLRVEERLWSDAGVTLLVNSAGFGAAAPLIDSDPDTLESMIQLNVVAPTRLARAVVPGFVARGNGTIINIASILALTPELLNGTTYSATKAYVVNFTQALHHELGGKHVRLQAVLPGVTRTEFWEAYGLPMKHLPAEIVMSAEEMVDAALSGLDQGELITIPSLPDAREWDAFNSARVALGRNLSRNHAAGRYKVAA